MGLTAIALNEFCYRYNNVKKLGLDTINLKINEGECILVTGRSGCGKTTLTRAINALIPHFYEGQISGKAYVYDIDVGNEPIHNVSKKVGSVFQDPRSQFFTTNTTSEIAFGMENLGYEREHMNDSIKIVSEYLGIEDLLNRSVHELSSGEKQKIAIASIYAMNPSIIVFDEPSANLDIESIVKLRGVMKVLKEKGHTIIIVEHRIHYLLGLVDRILYMDKGKIIEDMSEQQLVNMKDAVLRKKGIRTFDLKNVPVNVNHSQDTNRKTTGEKVLEVKNLKLVKDKKVILEDINLDVYKGEIVGIVGPCGSGKTTLVKTICGLMKEQSGYIYINGEQIKRKKRMEYTYFVMQDSDYQLFADTVRNELILGNKKENYENSLVDDVLKEFNLSHYRDRHPSTLSGGEKQRLTIAIAGFKNHSIQFFDEPTSGLDRDNMERVSDNLLESKKQGKSIVVISHDYEFILKTCSRIIQLEQGKVVDSYQLSEKTKSKLLKQVKKGDV